MPATVTAVPGIMAVRSQCRRQHRARGMRKLVRCDVHVRIAGQMTLVSPGLQKRGRQADKRAAGRLTCGQAGGRAAKLGRQLAPKCTSLMCPRSCVHVVVLLGCLMGLLEGTRQCLSCRAYDAKRASEGWDGWHLGRMGCALAARL